MERNIITVVKVIQGIQFEKIWSNLKKKTMTVC